MAIGDYRVKGHASLVSSPSIGRDCVAVFRVVPVEAPPAATTTYVSSERNEKEFHDNVKDAYFGMNSARNHARYAGLRLFMLPSTWSPIRRSRSSSADGRTLVGSLDFNLALAMKRASAVRSALIEAGVPPGQLEIISNGKSSQVCTTRDQECWKQNRRVSYAMKP